MYHLVYVAYVNPGVTELFWLVEIVYIIRFDL